jgi:dipeptidyl aminopeptidase/acylaminoacyl peptidase
MKLKILLFSLLSLHAAAQGTAKDYERADYIKESTKYKVYNEPLQVQWQGSAFWYKIQTPTGEEYYSVDSRTQKKTKLFHASSLTESLGKEAKIAVNAHELPLENLNFSDTGVTFSAYGKQWAYTFADTKLRVSGDVKAPQRPERYWGSLRDEREGNPILSPNKKWKAYIKNSNVYVSPVDAPEKETALSFDGSPGEYYAAGMSWSPDSKYLLANRIRPGGKRQLTLIESSPIDQLQPKLHTRDYLKPGDALNQKFPVLFHVEERKAFPVNPEMIANQYSLFGPHWNADSQSLLLEYNQRGHQNFHVIRIDTKTGQATAVVMEQSPTFFHYSGKKFLHYAQKTEELIWMSERDGWNHLYLYDAKTGKVKNQITKGPWVVRKVVKVDEVKRRILFEGSGKEKGQDPYFIQYYSVNFDGSDFRTLTQENGNHKATFSPDYSYFVDTWGRLDQPSQTVLREVETGKIVMPLEKADIKDLLKTGWVLPEVFVTTGRDDSTDIWGMIIRPSNFDPKKKYPVIEYIYAGPHDSFVPKNFVTDSRGDLHQLAELGFIVVQIDGMGTSNRSKAFHDVAWKNLKDSGFPDRMKWIKTAAKKYPYMDITRVGIFGNSAGGQSSAGALLHHPDFYKVAVSSSGCHDNRMDKIWWNEQWMGYPIGPHYEESSNVTHAHKLEGKLLLILGELDDNVDPSSTFQLINGIIKANKWVDFLFVPGMGHSLGGDYGEHRRRDFFVKHLIGVDPPLWTGHIKTAP